MQLYKALVLSKLDYGCEVYSSASTSKLNILNSIHHEGIRYVSGAFKSSPIASLLTDAGELPLNTHRSCAIIKYWFRAQRLPKSLTCKVIFNETYFDFYYTHPKSIKPFGFRVSVLMEEMGIPKHKVTPFKYSPIPPWNLPSIDFCQCPLSYKKDQAEEIIKK